MTTVPSLTQHSTWSTRGAASPKTSSKFEQKYPVSSKAKSVIHGWRINTSGVCFYIHTLCSTHIMYEVIDYSFEFCLTQFITNESGDITCSYTLATDSWISKGAIMRKMAFKDRKSKLVAVLVDLNNKTISWRAAGELSEHLDHASATQDEWMDLDSSRQKLFSASSATPLFPGGKNATVSSQTHSTFSPARSELRGQKSSCNLSKITAIHFGPLTRNMKTVVSTAKMLQPWRCWSFEVQRPRPRSYDFVTLSDKDAEHFVLGEIFDSRPCPPLNTPTPHPKTP